MLGTLPIVTAEIKNYSSRLRKRLQIWILSLGDMFTPVIYLYLSFRDWCTNKLNLFPGIFTCLKPSYFLKNGMRNVDKLARFKMTSLIFQRIYIFCSVERHIFHTHQYFLCKHTFENTLKTHCLSLML